VRANALSDVDRGRSRHGGDACAESPSGARPRGLGDLIEAAIESQRPSTSPRIFRADAKRLPCVASTGAVLAERCPCKLLRAD
jgi:hypothetical protein